MYHARVSGHIRNFENDFEMNVISENCKMF